MFYFHAPFAVLVWSLSVWIFKFSKDTLILYSTYRISYDLFIIKIVLVIYLRESGVAPIIS